MKHHILIFGWLRLFLGVAQISLAGAALWMLLTVGLCQLTWNLAGSGLTASFISFLIYKGSKTPHR